jgi:RNA polymerase sigma-70 factor (ECF subfamily)
VNDDALLIETTLSGETAAFGQLVLKYQDRLFHTIVHLAGNPDDALDIVQEAFVQAFVKLDSFQRASAFYTWLYRIAFNVAATHRRRRKPGADRVREMAGHDPADPRVGPVHELERKERARQVRQALAVLSEEHRVVLVLREIDGCCYETIAEVLDLPVGTVRSRLHRARLQLREQLKELLTVDDH